MKLLLTNNYMTDSFEKYTPTNNDIIDHLICRTIPSRISFYYDKKKGDLIGTMTSAYKQMIMSKINLNVGYQKVNINLKQKPIFQKYHQIVEKAEHRVSRKHLHRLLNHLCPWDQHPPPKPMEHLLVLV